VGNIHGEEEAEQEESTGLHGSEISNRRQYSAVWPVCHFLCTITPG